ncbi:3-keto-5-aminohexanoate cleavage protein [Paralcaligenes sp. KSB-10]|uniref:3-keto-5-aminohexanoate cleavage protein n=1 Tax=Paralcaligenes sp. KSB-10 TaxID=2901142 RepID=UPI001E6467A6|nr:3-keto-5-aminohexanoate cleavage protein [Paralcaligenes sp. KSB-10]UHL65635.1 3-keto-5-aminohexanoate cleavage protein [Paralcaligenes sp. KSB-10]
MKTSKKVIITCAVTGSIHTPSMSPYLPITPAEIARDAIDAAKAGASMLHLHARDPETGLPKQDPKLFAQFLPVIKEQTDAILNITTGGGLGMTLDERLAPAKWAQPEVASMNMGSFNFNISGAAGKLDKFKFDWEKPYLEMTRDFILSNTFAQIERGLNELSAMGTRFEFECYDVGHLYNVAHFVDRGLIKPPFFLQCIFGILGGIGAHQENLLHMRSIADKLFGDDYYLSVLAAGKHQLPFVTMSALLGGNVRVGLEDSLYAGKGRLAKSNAEQVTIIRAILEQLSMEVATPEEARSMIQTKGKDNVAF